MSNSIRYYLYFPQKVDAHRCSEALQNQGFRVDVSSSEIGDDWRVLATGTPSSFSDNAGEIPNYLEKLAEKMGGEYDGSEIPFNPDPFLN